MSLANEQDVLKLQNIGKRYAEDALTFFGRHYSQKPEIREVALFYATATAAMAEAMYAFMSANAEKEQADGWLAQLFGMIGKSLQTKRIPLPPALTLPAGDASGPPEVSTPIAGAKQAAAACICTLDPAGICPTCPGQIKASVRKNLLPVGDCLRTAQQGLLKVGGEKPCAPCTEAYLDAAVASVIMEGSLGELSHDIEPFANQIFEAIYEWASRRGVGEMPLTQKAWAIFSDRLMDQAPSTQV